MIKKIWKERIESIRKTFLQNNFDAALFSLAENISWLTFGGRNHITLNTAEGVASILVTLEKVYMITNNIEMERIYNEEIPSEIAGEFTPLQYNWWYDEYEIIEKHFPILKITSDTKRYGFKSFDKYDQIRNKLSPIEFDNFEYLGKLCDEILYDVMTNISPYDSETEIQGKIFQRFLANNTEPVLALVFGEQSSYQYRHNLPRNIRIGNKCFASVCVRYRGLIASSTRSVAFENNPSLIEQHRKNCMIDAAAINYSIPGNPLKKVFEHIVNSYREIGYIDEWKKHHQGGLAGYRSRESVATPYNEVIIPAECAVAWNPTITGTKSEDTALITESKKNIVTYPSDSKWPALKFDFKNNIISRPDIFIL